MDRKIVFGLKNWLIAMIKIKKCDQCWLEKV